MIVRFCREASRIRDGHIGVTVGQGTAWSNALVGRPLKLVDEPAVYNVVAVDSLTQLRISVRHAPEPIIPGYQGNTGSGKAYLLGQPGKWLADKLPAFDGVAYAQLDADSRLNY